MNGTTPETHAEIQQEDVSYPVRVTRAARQLAGIVNKLRPTEAELVEAGVLRVGAAQTAKDEAQYGNPKSPLLTVDQQSRAARLVEQHIREVN